MSTIEPGTTASLVTRAVLVADMAENIPSPCISVCRLDAQQAYCEGCLRSLDELRRWGSSSDVEKKAIWALVAQRAEAIVFPD